MRDIFLLGIFLVLIYYGIRKPIVALLTYYWISFMNPHRLTWGFTYHFPFAMIAAVVTLISVVIHSKEIRFPWTLDMFLFLIFWLFITVTTIFAFYPDDAWSYWIIVSKILLMTFLTMLIVTSPRKLLFLTLSIVLFIGFYGVKGAVFGLLTAGQYRLWGPPQSYIADNNSM
jgi:putative inorganic carbon (HCO3(-)) transporter